VRDFSNLLRAAPARGAGVGNEQRNPAIYHANAFFIAHHHCWFWKKKPPEQRSFGGFSEASD